MSDINITCQPQDLLTYIKVTLRKLNDQDCLSTEEMTILKKLLSEKEANIASIRRGKESPGKRLDDLSLEQLFSLCVRCYGHQMSLSQSLAKTLED